MVSSSSYFLITVSLSVLIQSIFLSVFSFSHASLFLFLVSVFSFQSFFLIYFHPLSQHFFRSCFLSFLFFYYFTFSLFLLSILLSSLFPTYHIPHFLHHFPLIPYPCLFLLLSNYPPFLRSPKQCRLPNTVSFDAIYIQNEYRKGEMVLTLRLTFWGKGRRTVKVGYIYILFGCSGRLCFVSCLKRQNVLSYSA